MGHRTYPLSAFSVNPVHFPVSLGCFLWHSEVTGLWAEKKPERFSWRNVLFFPAPLEAIAVT